MGEYEPQIIWRGPEKNGFITESSEGTDQEKAETMYEPSGALVILFKAESQSLWKARQGKRNQDGVLVLLWREEDLQLL